jgi:hypothetical protein
MGRRKQFGPALPPAMAKARRAARRKAAPSKKAQVALIKSVIAREAETKFRSELIVNSVPYNSAIDNADIIRLLPQIPQDDGNGVAFERLGVKISPRSLRVNCEVCLTDVTRSTALVVCYWVLTHKSQRNTANLTSSAGVEMGTLLRTGDGTEVQNFNGYVQDANLPVNTAKFTVLKHGKFMLGKNAGTVQDVSTSGNQPMYGNHIRHALNFNLKCPKTLTYEQDGTLPRTVYFPDGYAPFIVFGYYHQNQTAPDTVNQDIKINLRSSMYYDDA